MEILDKSLALTVTIHTSLEEEEANLLKSIKWRGYKNIEEYYRYFSTHWLCAEYDRTLELREQHDKELADWREERDRTLRISLHISLNPNLTLAEKWKELEDTYPLEPDGLILHFGDRLEQQE
jgi:hypothetical protein